MVFRYIFLNLCLSIYHSIKLKWLLVELEENLYFGFDFLLESLVFLILSGGVNESDTRGKEEDPIDNYKHCTVLLLS